MLSVHANKKSGFIITHSFPGVPFKDEKNVIGIFRNTEPEKLKKANLLLSQHAFCTNFQGMLNYTLVLALNS